MFYDAAGYFRRIDWHATRKFAASCAEARTLACGATFSPAALGGRMPHRPSTMCIWDGCTELGTFDHVLVALLTFLNLPSICLLGVVGSLQIKFVTLMLCMVGWFMCKRRFGPLSIHDLCLFVSWS